LSRTPAVRAKLVRSLTLIPAAAIILANIIGTGVFVKARVMTCNVGSPEMVLLVWLLAGLLTLCGALAGIILIIIGLPVYEYFRRRAGDVAPPFWQ